MDPYTKKRKKSWKVFGSSKSRIRSSSLSDSQSSLSSIGSQISNESTSAVESTLQELQRLVGNFKFPATLVDPLQDLGEVQIALKQFEDRLARIRFEMSHMNSSPVDLQTCEQELVVLYDDTKVFLRDLPADWFRQPQPKAPDGKHHLEKLNDIQRRLHAWGRRSFPSTPVFARQFEPQHRPPGPSSAALPPRTFYVVHFQNKRPRLYYTEGTELSVKPKDMVVVEDALGDNVGTVVVEVDFHRAREIMLEHMKGHLNALLELSNRKFPIILMGERLMGIEDLTKTINPIKRLAGAEDLTSLSQQRRWEETAKSMLLQSPGPTEVKHSFRFIAKRFRFEVLAVENQGSGPMFYYMKWSRHQHSPNFGVHIQPLQSLQAWSDIGKRVWTCEALAPLSLDDQDQEESVAERLT